MTHSASLAISAPPTVGQATVEPATQTIRYTPPADYVGPVTFTYAVSTSIGTSRTATVRLTVAPLNDPPQFVTTLATQATVASPYRAVITTRDVDGGDQLVISAPTLPSWLTLDDRGDGTAELNGLPTSQDVGSHTVALRVTDQAGGFASQQVTLVVQANQPPRITSRPPTTATEREQYTYLFAASDPDVGQTLTFSTPLLPRWLQVVGQEPGKLRLEGRPLRSDIGDHAVWLVVTDPGGLIAEQRFDLTVVAANAPEPPTGLTATARDATSVQLRWGVGSSEATTFLIERRQEGAAWQAITELGPETTSYTDRGLVCGVAFSYRVSAIREAVRSAPSTSTTVTPTQLRLRQYQQSGPPQVIGGPGGADLTLAVYDAGILTDVDVQLAIQHIAAGSLRIWLIAPDGTRIQLAEAYGRPGPDFQGTIFDDDAAGALVAGYTPFTGRFRPKDSLATLAGKQMTGIWRLMVENRGNFTGVLTDFGLDLTTSAGCPGLPPTPTSTPAPTVVGSATPTRTVTPTPLPTRTGGPPTILYLNGTSSAGTSLISEGAILSAAPWSFTLGFPQAIEGYSANTIFLIEEGPTPGFQTNGCVFDPGDTSFVGNFVNYYYAGRTITRGYYAGSQGFYEGRYRLIVCDTIANTYPLLDGDGDGLPGGTFVRTFVVQNGVPRPTSLPTQTSTATATMMPPTSTPTATAMPTTPVSAESSTATATILLPTNTPTATATPTTPANTATPTATIIPASTATSTATRTPTATSIATTEELLRLDYTTGQAGSVLQITGQQFVPDARLSVLVNGVAIGSVTVDQRGSWFIALATDPQAAPGQYAITVAPMLTQTTASWSVAYRLGAGYPLRVSSGDIPTLAVPRTIAPQGPQRLYVPMLVVGDQ